eukprot:7665860-Pyramimonas_sp.AAC.1
MEPECARDGWGRPGRRPAFIRAQLRERAHLASLQEVRGKAPNWPAVLDGPPQRLTRKGTMDAASWSTRTWHAA